MSPQSAKGGSKRNEDVRRLRRTFTLSEEAYEWLRFIKKHHYPPDFAHLTLDDVLDVLVITTGRFASEDMEFWPTENAKCAE